MGPWTQAVCGRGSLRATSRTNFALDVCLFAKSIIPYARAALQTVDIFNSIETVSPQMTSILPLQMHSLEPAQNHPAFHRSIKQHTVVKCIFSEAITCQARIATQVSCQAVSNVLRREGCCLHLKQCVTESCVMPTLRRQVSAKQICPLMAAEGTPMPGYVESPHK